MIRYYSQIHSQYVRNCGTVRNELDIHSKVRTNFSQQFVSASGFKAQNSDTILIDDISGEWLVYIIYHCHREFWQYHGIITISWCIRAVCSHYFRWAETNLRHAEMYRIGWPRKLDLKEKGCQVTRKSRSRCQKSVKPPEVCTHAQCTNLKSPYLHLLYVSHIVTCHLFWTSVYFWIHHAAASELTRFTERNSPGFVILHPATNVIFHGQGSAIRSPSSPEEQGLVGTRAQ